MSKKVYRISLDDLTEKQQKKIKRYANILLRFKKDIKQVVKQVELKTKRYRSSNIANKKKKFYGTALGVYKLRKKIDKQFKFFQSKEYEKLSERQQIAFKRANEKLWLKFLRWNARKKANEQIKQDRIEAYEHAKAQYLERVASYKAGTHTAGETYYVHRSTAESYRLNETTNIDKEICLRQIFGDKKVDKAINDNGYDGGIQQLLDEALKKGKIKELAQGVGYGYITADYSEVISPP